MWVLIISALQWPTSASAFNISAPPAQPAGPVRIGLQRSVTSTEVSSPGGLYVVAQGAVQAQVPPGTALRLVLVQGGVEVLALGRRFVAPVRLVPVPAAPTAPVNPVIVGGRRYRGEIEVVISPKDKLFSVVNMVNLEDYLMGVVPYEMTYTWPLEALKAQAVAARTYSLMHLGQFSAEGFDMVDTVTNQVYGGMGGEYARTSEAVRATRGQVLTAGSKLVSTYYHSSSGGFTESNEIIWGGSPVSYLRGVPDFDNLPGNLRFAWRFSFTPAAVAEKLLAAGYGVGTVTSITPEGTTGASGRPSHWRIIGTAGSLQVTAQSLRFALDVPSSPKGVVVQPGGSVEPKATYADSSGVTVVGASGSARVRVVQGTMAVGASGVVTAVVAPVVAVAAPEPRPAGVEVMGGGYGHAVGMSQWGAHGMALLGKSYVEILAHYYQGSKMETR